MGEPVQLAISKRGPEPGAAAKAAAAAKKAKSVPAAPKAQGTTTFSAAGNMHGDLKKSSKDSTLENSLFAAFNTD